MLNPESDFVTQLDTFIDMVRTRDQALPDALWGDGSFFMVGSEAGETCRTRLELAAELMADDKLVVAETDPLASRLNVFSCRSGLTQPYKKPVPNIISRSAANTNRLV